MEIVKWVFTTDQIEKIGLPDQELHGGLLRTGVDPRISLGIFAIAERRMVLPSPEISEFTLGGKKFRIPQTIARPVPRFELTGLPVNRPILAEEYRHLHQAPITGRYPYVLLGDGTNYGFGLWIPTDLWGRWEEDTKDEESGKRDGRELTITTSHQTMLEPAILASFNGRTPLCERVDQEGVSTENLLSIRPSTIKDGISFVLIDRKLTTSGGKSDASELVFRRISESGTPGNAILDQEGLVALTVVLCRRNRDVRAEVLKPEPGPTQLLAAADPNALSHGYNLVNLSAKKPVYRSLNRGSSDQPAALSTARGATSFERPKEVTVESSTVSIEALLAHFRLALVSLGGTSSGVSLLPSFPGV